MGQDIMITKLVDGMCKTPLRIILKAKALMLTLVIIQLGILISEVISNFHKTSLVNIKQIMANLLHTFKMEFSSCYRVTVLLKPLLNEEV